MRLRSEISQVAGLGTKAQQPSRANLKRMKYLGCVIRESLRLYPPVPVNARAAVKTTTLPTGGGTDGKAPVLVRKGESVSYSPYVMHRRKDIYGDDATKFRPERWEDGGLDNVGYGYLPFNAGPCLGQDYAMLEISYTIARLMQRFPSMVAADDSQAPEIGNERQILSLVLLCEDGCWVKLRGTE